MRSMLGGLIQRHSKKKVMILFYKTCSAHNSHCSFFTLSPKETGFPYEKGQDYVSWKEHKCGQNEVWTQCISSCWIAWWEPIRGQSTFQILVLYPGLMEEIALKQTKEGADMKSICKVPLSYGGRQCASLLWLLNMSQLPRKMSFPLNFLSVVLIGYWGVFRL